MEIIKTVQFITRPPNVVMPWASDNGLHVSDRDWRSITLTWGYIKKPFGMVGLFVSPRGIPTKPNQPANQPTFAVEATQDPENTLYEIGMQLTGTIGWTSIYKLGVVQKLRESEGGGGGPKCHAPVNPSWVRNSPKRTRAHVAFGWAIVVFKITLIISSKNDVFICIRGYGRKYKVDGLKSNTNINFRLRKNNELHWGQVITASTERPPPNADDLHGAIKCSHASLVLGIITGTKPDHMQQLLASHDRVGNTPLMAAALCGNSEILGYLLRCNPNVNAISLNTGRTALMMACFNGNLSCIMLLDGAGADWHHRDSSGCNVLHHGVSGDAEHLKALHHVVKKVGLDKIDEKDNSGWTPLLRSVILAQSPEFIRILLQYGANPNATDKRNGKSCLFAAVMAGKIEFVALLLEYKANPAYANANGETVLSIAEAYGCKKIIKMLEIALENIKSVPDADKKQQAKTEPKATEVEKSPKKLPKLGDPGYLVELEKQLNRLALEAAQNDARRMASQAPRPDSPPLQISKIYPRTPRRESQHSFLPVSSGMISAQTQAQQNGLNEYATPDITNQLEGQRQSQTGRDNSSSLSKVLPVQSQADRNPTIKQKVTMPIDTPVYVSISQTRHDHAGANLNEFQSKPPRKPKAPAEGVQKISRKKSDTSVQNHMSVPAKETINVTQLRKPSPGRYHEKIEPNSPHNLTGKPVFSKTSSHLNNEKTDNFKTINLQKDVNHNVQSTNLQPQGSRISRATKSAYQEVQLRTSLSRHKLNSNQTRYELP